MWTRAAWLRSVPQLVGVASTGFVVASYPARRTLRPPLQSVAIPGGYLEAIETDLASFKREMAREDAPSQLRRISEEGQRGGYDLILPFLNRYTNPALPGGTA